MAITVEAIKPGSGLPHLAGREGCPGWRGGLPSVRKTYETLNRIGRLTPEIKLNLRRIKVVLCVRYLKNMIVEVPQRNPRMH